MATRDKESGSATGKAASETGASTVAVAAIPGSTVVTSTQVPASVSARTTINATADHPFWNADTRAWVPAKNLTPGTRALDLTGKPVQILSIKPYRQTLTAYNLTVEGLHTYHIGAGTLVHNTEGCEPDLDALSAAGAALDRNGLTQAGRSLQKHGDREGTVFPRSTGSLTQRNQQGQDVLDEILTDPNGTMNVLDTVTDVFDSSGRGVRFYNSPPSMKGFREPQ